MTWKGAFIPAIIAEKEKELGTYSLDSVCSKYGTDKASTHPVKGHDYCRHYEKFFEHLRDNPIKFLEVGVGGGESIRAWLEYFKQAHIYGVDIIQDTNIFNMPGKPFDRYTFSHGNQTDRTGWKCFLANCGSDWDVIVDDGSHMADAVIITFEELWPHVVSGGLYCVEDLGVGVTPGTVFVPKGYPNHFDWLASLIKRDASTKTDFDSFYFAQELVIIKKR